MSQRSRSARELDAAATVATRFRTASYVLGNEYGQLLEGRGLRCENCACQPDLIVVFSHARYCERCVLDTMDVMARLDPPPRPFMEASFGAIKDMYADVAKDLYESSSVLYSTLTRRGSP